MSNHIHSIINIIQESEVDSNPLKNLEGVSGLSGAKLIGFLQRSANYIATNKNSDRENFCYLEIGVFQGLTLTSVAASTTMSCYGIDNFSQFDPDNKNQDIVIERIKKHTNNNAFLIDSDFEDALLSLPQKLNSKNLKISLYFIDGPHDYRSQYLCLDFAKPHFADDVVIVIDDSNYEHVRRSTADWLKANPDFTLLFEAYTHVHPKNSTDSESEARDGWWNGVNILVRDPDKTLPRTYPTVSSDRTRYFNDHIIHASKYAEFAPKLLSFAARILPAALFAGDYKHRFRSMNTYSNDLPKCKIVKPIVKV